MVLPTEKVLALYKSPRKLFIYSSPKVGKTTLTALLDNSLLLDFEKGSDFIDAVKINVDSISQLSEILAEVKKAGKPYKYGIVDTTTKLEEFVLPLALDMYKKTPMGSSFKGDNILTLPNGAGYFWLREAYTKVSNAIDDCFDRIIYTGHLKDKVLEKAGKEVSAKDIDLTGKIRNIACANADAIGFLYRENNKTVLSFKTTQEILCGARPDHLRDKEIIMLEYDKDTKTFTHHWDEVYID